MKDEIKKLVKDALGEDIDSTIEHPADPKHGDYSTNVSIVLAKVQGKNPHQLANEIVEKIRTNIVADKKIAEDIERVEVAGPGFINFFLSRTFFDRSIRQIVHAETQYGRNKNLQNRRIIIEYTDPNPFKQFHIGHLMSNSIGESLARIVEWNGAEVVRVCYQGDVGMHVAKTIWGIRNTIDQGSPLPSEDSSIEVKTKYIGDAYTLGANRYDEDARTKAEIETINKQVYDLFDETKTNDDPEIRRLYDRGREWSLAHFDQIYAKLGTNFAKFIFESQMARIGSEIVRENVPEVFEMSEGAVIYRGEQDGLHTRVFINSLGLPTYEAKDIGLAFFKERDLSEKFGKFDRSVIVTANEQKEYYRVVRAALMRLDPKVAEKTFHITHGMMRFADGKMSSRAGNIITGESLIADIETMIEKKISDREFSADEARSISEIIAVGAIKYSILKQAIGRDIIFDPKTSISFEGDSGPYLQYTHTRAKSIIDKAAERGISFADAAETISAPANWQTTALERTIYQFPEVIESAYNDLAPHQVANFLSKLCGEFNTFYASTQILDGTPAEAFKLALTKATMQIIRNGLKVLGIKVPTRM